MLTVQLNAQNDTCAQFSVLSTSADTTNTNTLWYAVRYGAASNSFVSYPYIAFVLDCNGDTLSKGNMYYFGQIGQTTQAYPVTQTGKGNPNCYPHKIALVYNSGSGNFDTCNYTFTSTSIANKSSSEQLIQCHTNPVQNALELTFKSIAIGDHIKIQNTLGQVVLKQMIHSLQQTFDISCLPKGVYFVSVEALKTTVLKVVKE
jgi:hypothetical protein